MGIWADIDADLPDLFDGDGEQIAITTGGTVYYVKAFWRALSLEGGEQGGQAFYCSTDDLPSGFAQGDTVSYASTTYTVTHRQPDGHGIERVVLWDES